MNVIAPIVTQSVILISIRKPSGVTRVTLLIRKKERGVILRFPFVKKLRLIILILILKLI